MTDMPDMPEVISAVAQAVLEQAWKFRKEGPVLPAWFLFDRQGALNVVGTPFDQGVPDVKSRMAQAVAQEVRKHRAQAVLFVSDAWVRTVPADAPEAERHHRPSESVDAVEALTLQCWTREGRGFCLMRLYRERDDGTLSVVDEMTSSQPPTMDGFARVVVEALQQSTKNTYGQGFQDGQNDGRAGTGMVVHDIRTTTKAYRKGYNDGWTRGRASQQ